MKRFLQSILSSAIAFSVAIPGMGASSTIPLPAPSDLSCENQPQGISLTWTAASTLYVPGIITEDFENGDSFSNQFGDWTFVDGDQEAVWNPNATAYPNIEGGVTKGSFWVFDRDIVNADEAPNSQYDAYSGSKYLMALYRFDDGQTNDWAISPALSGEAQTISFYARSFSRFAEKIQVYWSATGTAIEDFQPIESSLVNAVPMDWTLYSVNLPEGAVHFAIRSFAAGSEMLEIDDVTFIPAPRDMTLLGYNIYRNGEKLNVEPVLETTYIDRTANFDVEYSYTVKAVFSREGESNASNIASIIRLEIDNPDLPAPTDLSAINIDEGIQLTWNAPEVENEEGPVTEDFENGDSFSNQFGDWTFVDGDQEAVWNPNATAYPNIEGGVTKGSFWIFDREIINADEAPNSQYDAHSGSKYLMALYRFDDGQTNDWAISPALSGEAQTISFYARSFSRFAEKIQVYWSATGTAIEDFQPIESSLVNAVPMDWTLYSVNLPEGAIHFAIRSFAAGSEMLEIDDVTFIPARMNLNLTGYNIFRNGNKINNEPITDTTYLDANIEIGVEYVYIVKALYENLGQSVASNEVRLSRSTVGVNSHDTKDAVIHALNGHILVSGAEDMALIVYSSEGKVIFNGRTRPGIDLDVAPGLYIATIGKTIHKVVVR